MVLAPKAGRVCRRRIFENAPPVGAFSFYTSPVFESLSVKIEFLCALMSHHRSQLLFFFALAFFAGTGATLAQVADRDSNRISTAQSWPDTLQPENYRTSLLGSSFSYYDVLISRFADPIHPARIDENIPLALPAFSNLLRLHSNNIQLDTTKAASRLNVILGSKREQILFLDHRQRLSKSLTWDLSYNSVVSEGFLIHQFSKFKGFHSGLSLHTQKYIFEAGYVFHKVEAEENGGILPGQKTDNLSKSDYALLSVYLNDAQSKVRKSDVYFNQALKLTSISNRSTLSLIANSAFTRIRRSYSDTPDSVFFAKNYLDSSATADTMQLRTWRNSIGLRLANSPDSSHHTIWFLETGALNSVDQYLTDSLSAETTNWMPYVKAGVSLKSLDLEGHAMSSTNAVDGEKDSYVGTLSALWHVHDTYLDAIKCTFHSGSYAPAYNVRRLISNHFVWQNKDFKNEIENAVEVAIDLFGGGMEVYGIYSVKQHAVVFNEHALPEELDKQSAVSSFGSRVDYHLRHWRLMADVSRLQSSVDEIPVPDYRIYARVSYQNNFFKGALKAEFGAACNYTSAYKALAYQPATGVYFFQSAQSVAGQPNASLFVNLGIGKAILSVQMENLMHGMSGNDNYAGPGYPVPPRTLKFGLKWWLVN